MSEYVINNETGEVLEKQDVSELVVKETSDVINYEEIYDLFEQSAIAKAKLESVLDKVKPIILQQMKDKGIKSFEHNGIKFQYRKGYMRENFDSKKFKLEHEDLYNQYSYLKGIDESIAISMKED